MNTEPNTKLVKLTHAINIAASVPDPNEPQVQEYLQKVVSGDSPTENPPNPD